MGKSSHIIRRGPLKGKKVELASTAGLDSCRDVAELFMSDIFDMEPGDCLLTDESSLRDFVGVDDLELADILSKIADLYGVDVADAKGGNLLEIFRRIQGTG